MIFTDLKRQNMQAVLKSIMNGNNTLNEIVKDVGITKVTACDLTKELVSKNIIKYDNPPRNSVGKRPNVYSIVSDYHCMYFEELRRRFSCISIDINGQVVDRFDVIYRKDLSKKENLKILYKKFRKSRLFNKRCIDIFAVCSDETAKYLPKNTIRTTKEDIILKYLSEPDKMILFNLDKKIVISAYTHIHYPQKGVGMVIANKVLKFDKTYIFNKELYDGLFLAMEKHSLNRLLDII